MSTRALADDFIASTYGAARPSAGPRQRFGTKPTPDAGDGASAWSGLERTSGPGEGDGASGSGTGDHATADALGQALKFIPSDVVAAYTLLLNLVPKTVDSTLLWAFYGGFAFFSGLAVFCQARQLWVALPAEGRAPWVFPSQGVIAAVVAFLAWGAAVPGTVFARVPQYETWMGLVAVVVITLVLNLFDGVFTSKRASTATEH